MAYDDELLSFPFDEAFRDVGAKRHWIGARPGESSASERFLAPLAFQEAVQTTIQQ